MLGSLDSLLNAITGIFNLIVSLVDFVFSLVRDLLIVVDMLGKFIIELPSWFNVFMPPGLTPVLMVLLSVTIIYRVTGRD